MQESPGKILFNAIRTCAALSPLIIVFLITSIYHGNAEIAHAINASLFDLWRTITPNACCLSTPGGAINALQWSAQKGLSLSYEVLSEFLYGVYAPLAWACSILFCFIYLTGLLQNSQSTYPETATDLTEEKSRLAFLLFLQFICIFPLFILGRDFGRWIFLWTCSALIIYFIGINYESGLIRNATGYTRTIIVAIASRWRPKEWHLLFFGIPGSCWTVASFATSTPSGQLATEVWRVVRKILKLTGFL